MDPLITWQQNRPGLSDSLPAAEPQPARLAFVNTFLPRELLALPWGPVAPWWPWGAQLAGPHPAACRGCCSSSFPLKAQCEIWSEFREAEGQLAERPWDEKASFCSSGKNQRISRLGSCLPLETDGECRTRGRRPAAPATPGTSSFSGVVPAPCLSLGSFISWPTFCAHP